MNIMAPTVDMIAQAAGYGDRRTGGYGYGRPADAGGHSRSLALVGSNSATSREATINAADILS